MEIRWKRAGAPGIEWREKEGVPYLTYQALEQVPGICCGFSTRLGGVSRGIFSSMNLSFTRGDDPEAVKENYRRIGRALGFAPENLVSSDQTHTANVVRVQEANRGSGIVRERDFSDVDGLISNLPGVTLATYYADCVPLFFVDPVHRAVGLSHSGWRGTVQKIGRVTVQRMTEEFGTDPKDLLAAVGPSICQDCYEVSEDVILEFQKVFPETLWTPLWYAKENGKYQLNLWEANRQIFLEAGILENHISMPNLCTCCNPELLFSHRASKGKRGNLAAFLGLRES